MVTLFMGQPYTRNMLQLPNVQVTSDCLRVGNSTSLDTVTPMSLKEETQTMYKKGIIRVEVPMEGWLPGFLD